MDVVKVLMLKTVSRALAARGHGIHLYELERLGIAKVLGELRLMLLYLQLKGCTLLYRRQVEDMPLAEISKDATPEQVEKARATRRKLLQNFAEKYLFALRDCCVPLRCLAEGDHLAGLTLGTTEVQDARAIPLSGSEHDVRSPMVISSIGSISEPIQGVGMQGSL